ncbi:Lrp/AsnC ligand binding domain-containing protein [Candidatus Bathyarchaeota archaeon]|nr:Lrp/AsnC ligand binding domain-containing protein [Candidatus Bathyarchaeota archaeon]
MTVIRLDGILDSTLREGEQTPTVYFTPEEKCRIAEMIYLTLGSRSVLEIGAPYSPEYTEGVEAVVKYFDERGYKALLASHCRTLRGDVDIAWKCGTRCITVFMAASDKHLLYKFDGLSYEAALNRIRDVIRYAKDIVGFDRVEYTLEDATSMPIERIIEVAKTAEEAGADVVKIPDTKGQTDPWSFYDIISKLVESISIPVDVHCHNDRGLAVANSIAALKAGARYVNVAVMGLGERCGIADMATLVENLETLYGVDTGVNFKMIPKLYRYVSAVTGIPIHPQHPIIGRFARIHKAGTHQKTVLRAPDAYETIDWSKYGLEREYEFGAMQSKELVNYILRGFDVSEDKKMEIVEEIRRRSMHLKRSLKMGEVWRIIEEKTGISMKTYEEYFDAIIFIKTKPSIDEESFLRMLREYLLELEMTWTTYEVTGLWDYILHLKNVGGGQQLDEITARIRRMPAVVDTSTSIVFEEYR